MAPPGLSSDDAAVPPTASAGQRTGYVRTSAVRQGVAVVTLDRPDRRNAVGPELAADLAAALARLDADRRVRAIVLAGAGPSFCAGADMKARLAGAEGSATVLAAVRRASAAVHDVSVPIVAAVHGHALGAGLELAAVCDYRVVEEGAVLGLPEVQQGITSGGGLLALATVVGAGTLARLAYTGTPLDAAGAGAVGLADEVVAPAHALPAARRLALRMAERPRPALVAAKQALRLATQPLHPQQWATVGLLQHTLEGGPAQQEALQHLADRGHGA